MIDWLNKLWCSKPPLPLVLCQQITRSRGDNNKLIYTHLQAPPRIKGRWGKVDMTLINPTRLEELKDWYQNALKKRDTHNKFMVKILLLEECDSASRDH